MADDHLSPFAAVHRFHEGEGPSATRGVASVGAAPKGEFARLTYPFRPELLAHCYRMLGSVHDAEDLVQETYLRAWRYYDGFEGRSSLRTWLYRIATTSCLTALEQRGRRPLPSGLNAASDDPTAALTRGPAEVAWLQPIPDALVLTEPTDPATTVALRGSLRLALVAAMQHLPARQRAVLILRDVLAFQATEVAELLDTSAAAVHSALRRARARLATIAPVEDAVVEPAGTDQQVLLDRYIAAFEDADVTALLALLRKDIVLEMPPFLAWFTGPELVVRFLAIQCLHRPGKTRMLRAAANGQPAAAAYSRGGDGVYRAEAVHVLTATDTAITRIVAFFDRSLFASFGLPLTLGTPAVEAAIQL